MNQTLLIADPAPLAEPRVAEILASVRHAFSEKGFDGASMQDLARAAGMSVGNFYRYFPSKSAIVAAMIESDLSQLEADFAAICLAPDPFTAMKAAVRIELPKHQAAKDGQLWAEITAAAQRNSDIGAAAARMEARVTAAMRNVIARQTGLTVTEVAQRFAAEADFILMMFKAASGSCGPQNRQNDKLTDLMVASIDQTLDSISQSVRNS